MPDWARTSWRSFRTPSKDCSLSLSYHKPCEVALQRSSPVFLALSITKRGCIETFWSVLDKELKKFATGFVDAKSDPKKWDRLVVKVHSERAQIWHVGQECAGGLDPTYFLMTNSSIHNNLVHTIIKNRPNANLAPRQICLNRNVHGQISPSQIGDD